MKAELSQAQSNKPLHKNPERSYINNDDTLEMFRKAIRNDIHKECIERKKIKLRLKSTKQKQQHQ